MFESHWHKGGVALRAVINAMRTVLVTTSLFFTVPLLAADAGATSGPVTNQFVIGSWMAGLAGMYRVQGSLETTEETGRPDRMAVAGQADCRRVHSGSQRMSPAEGVECFLEMTWAPAGGPDSTTAGAAALSQHSAVLLLASDRSVTGGTRHMLVDERGEVETGTALLVNDALVSESPCAAANGKCLRRMRIAVGADRSVTMSTDVEINGMKTRGQHLILQRVEDSR